MELDGQQSSSDSSEGRLQFPSHNRSDSDSESEESNSFSREYVVENIQEDGKDDSEDWDGFALHIISEVIVVVVQKFVWPFGGRGGLAGQIR